MSIDTPEKHERLIYDLRVAFQERCTDGSWTATEEDIEELLAITRRTSLILQAMRVLGTFLRREREDRLMYYTSEEAIELLKKYLWKEKEQAELSTPAKRESAARWRTRQAQWDARATKEQECSPD